MKDKNQPPSVPPCQGGRQATTETPTGPTYSIVAAEVETPSLDKGRAGEGLGLTSAFLPYNKALTALARENRNNPTKPESRIWNFVLRQRQRAAYKFLRQKPIGNFIVDFYCSELCLVIEIDGDSHAETIEYDELRTAELQSLGLTVIRYSNHEVMGNIEGVYEDLWSRIQDVVTACQTAEHAVVDHFPGQ